MMKDCEEKVALGSHTAEDTTIYCNIEHDEDSTSSPVATVVGMFC